MISKIKLKYIFITLTILCICICVIVFSTVKFNKETNYIMAYTRPTDTYGSNVEYMGFYGDSMHIAYSNDGISWNELNDNKGILFYKHEDRSTGADAKQLRNPFIFEMADGGFGVITTSVRYNGELKDSELLFWTTDDLIEFSQHDNIPVAPKDVVAVDPYVVYDNDTQKYIIHWTNNTTGKTYKNTIDMDFSVDSITKAIESNEYSTLSQEAILSYENVPEGAIIGSVISVSQEVMEGILKHYDTPKVPIGSSQFELTTNIGEEVELPATAEIYYSDGSVENLRILWEKAKGEIDYNTAGTYTLQVPLEGMTTFTNPINENGADPDIFRYNDKYYYTSSYMDYENNLNGDYQYDRIAIRTADTLAEINGAYERVVFWRKEEGPGSYHIWAPEIRYVNFTDEPKGGQWVIYFAGGKISSPFDLHVYAIVCDSQDPMTGNWSDMMEVAALNGFDAEDGSNFMTSFDLDATVFKHNGEWYMIWASKPFASNLVISKMINSTTVEDPMGGTATIAVPEYTWERRNDLVVEGGTVMVHGDKLYVGYAAGSTDATYCLGLLSIDVDDDLLNPENWNKIPYPLMISNPENNQFGPGHATFSVLEDGVTPILSYYARNVEKYSGQAYEDTNHYMPLYDATRRARIAIVYFHEDGTPYYGLLPADGYLPGSFVEVEITVIEN